MSRRALPALLVALTLVASCTNEDDGAPPSPDGRAAPRPVRGGSVTVGVFGEPPTLDPYSPRATDLTFAVLRPVYRSLFDLMPDGSTRPDLARSVEPTSQGATIQLRRARWSNGHAITARDVVASIRRARPPSGFASIRRARATSRRTVELSGRLRNLEQTLARVAFVLPNGRASRAGGAFAGPFEIVRFTPGLRLTYAPNPGWAGSRPYLRRVRVTFVTGTLMLMRLLQLGRLDAAALPSSVNLDERLEIAELEHDEVLGYETVVVDFASSGLDRQERFAVVHTIDDRLLKQGLVRDDGRRTYTLHPTPDRANGPFESLPAESSKPSGTQLLLVPAGDELLQLFQRVMDRELDNARIEVDLVRLAPSELYGGGSIVHGVELRRVAGAPGLQDSRRAVRTLDRYPLFQVKTVVGWRPGLNGVEVNPTSEGVLDGVERWWWTEGRRP